VIILILLGKLQQTFLGHGMPAVILMGFDQNIRYFAHLALFRWHCPSFDILMGKLIPNADRVDLSSQFNPLSGRIVLASLNGSIR